jgi:20S proteasome alpha/beta subunit
MFAQELGMQQLNSFDPYQPVSMGTTLISIKYNGGVMMATDCMTSSGNFISDRGAKKVMELSPSTMQFGSIKVIRCGTAAHSQMVSRIVYNQLSFHTMEFTDESRLRIETVV